MDMTLFAVDIDSSLTNLQQLGLNVLMVIGAFVAGYALTWILLFLTRKYVHKKTLPHGFNKFMRLMGGLTAAILMALWVSGVGGGDYGDPGGSGQGRPEGSEPGRPEVMPELPEKPEKPIKPGAGEVEREYQVEVIVIGGTDDPLERYYMISPEYEAITYEDLTAELEAARSESGKPLKSIKIFFRNKELPGDHVLVARLKRWASRAGLSVNFPPEGERMR